MTIYNIEQEAREWLSVIRPASEKAGWQQRWSAMQSTVKLVFTEKSKPVLWYLPGFISHWFRAFKTADCKQQGIQDRYKRRGDGEIIYQAPSPAEQQSINQFKSVPAQYDFVLATYSAIQLTLKRNRKPNFLRAIAEDNIFIMDEAPQLSGSSTPVNFAGLFQNKGIVFLSATFAKRPDNMPIYAMKTSIVIAIWARMIWWKPLPGRSITGNIIITTCCRRANGTKGKKFWRCRNELFVVRCKIGRTPCHCG